MKPLWLGATALLLGLWSVNKGALKKNARWHPSFVVWLIAYAASLYAGWLWVYLLIVLVERIVIYRQEVGKAKNALLEKARDPSRLESLLSGGMGMALKFASDGDIDKVVEAKSYPVFARLVRVEATQTISAIFMGIAQVGAFFFIQWLRQL